MTTRLRARGAFKICGGLLIPFLLIFTGCGPSNQEILAKERLASAKAAYAVAKVNPYVEIHAQSSLKDAGKTVDLASQAKNFDEMEHLAYLAERKTQIAVAVAEQQMAENEKTALGRETERLIARARGREQRAKVEARESNWLGRASYEKARISNEQSRVSDAQARKSSAQAKKIFAEAKKSDQEAWTQRAIAQRAEKDADLSAAQSSASSAEARASSEQARKADAQARKSNAEALAQTYRTEKAQARANNNLEQEIIGMKGKMTDRGIVLTIGDVLFANGTASLSPVADNEIDKLASFLKEYPNRNVLIEGHTDSTGTEGANLDLSITRANAVRDKLIARDISLSRITTSGLGQNSPLAANDNAAGRERNRRVDIIILNEGVSPLTSK